MQQGINNVVSFAAGVVVGVGLEYLLDPDVGSKRRRHYSSLIGGYATDMGDRVRHLGEEAFERVGQTTRTARHWTADSGKHLRRYASDHSGNGSDHETTYDPTSLIGTAMGALGLGALMMYVMDPQQGRRRRSLARDQMVGRWNDARRYAGNKTRYAAGYAKGYAHEARAAMTGDHPSDEQLRERIRSELGHCTTQAGSIEVDVRDGTVILRGNAAPDELNKIVSCVRDVRGVQNVENHLQGV